MQRRLQCRPTVAVISTKLNHRKFLTLASQFYILVAILQPVDLPFPVCHVRVVCRFLRPKNDTAQTMHTQQYISETCTTLCESNLSSPFGRQHESRATSYWEIWTSEKEEAGTMVSLAHKLCSSLTDHRSRCSKSGFTPCARAIFMYFRPPWP